MKALEGSKNRFMPEASLTFKDRQHDSLRQDHLMFLKRAKVEPQVKVQFLHCKMILTYNDQLFHCRNSSCQNYLCQFSIKPLIMVSSGTGCDFFLNSVVSLFKLFLCVWLKVRIFGGIADGSGFSLENHMCVGVFFLI